VVDGDRSRLIEQFEKMTQKDQIEFLKLND